MQQEIQRAALLAESQIRLTESPVVALLGARQVGKTTLARHIQAAWQGPSQWFDLERPAHVQALQATPELTLAACRGLVVIDEVQRLPELFAILRPLVDASDRQQTFLLLGSAAPDLVRGISESLAGRVQTITVPGISLSEWGAAAAQGTQHTWQQMWLRGSFPRALLAASDQAAERWLEGFRQTFLERDIPALGSRVPAASLGLFWTMLAHFHGQVWNAAELARSLDTSPKTANNYRDLLAGTFMLRVLQPWHENLGKRQVKSPKVYLRDSGILHHLLGIGDGLTLAGHPRYGASWEGFALEQTLVHHGERDSWFWATQRGAELDLLLQRHGRRWGFEFKCSDAPSITKSMRIAQADLGLEHLYVIYPGNDPIPLDAAITALPLTHIPQLTLR